MSAIINARAQQVVMVARSVYGCIASVMARIDDHLTRHDRFLRKPRKGGGWGNQPGQPFGTSWCYSPQLVKVTSTTSGRRRPTIPVPTRLYL